MSTPLPETPPAGQAAPPSGNPAAPSPGIPGAAPPAAPAAGAQGAPAAPTGRVGDANSFSVQAALQGISDALTALPERVVDGVREAGQAAPPAPVVNTPQPTNSPTPGNATANANAGTAKRRTFGEWWFGKS